MNPIQFNIRDHPPCQGCGDRKPGCHDSCTRYADWKAEIKRVNDNRLEYDRGKKRRRKFI